MTKYFVTASHIVAEYACTDLEASIGHCSHSGMYYASMAGYGCSKDASTPEAAIRNMLADHACTNIRIRTEDC